MTTLRKKKEFKKSSKNQNNKTSKRKIRKLSKNKISKNKISKKRLLARDKLWGGGTTLPWLSTSPIGLEAEEPFSNSH